MSESSNGGSKLLTPGFSRLRAPTIVKKSEEGPPQQAKKQVEQDLNQAEQPKV